MDRHLLLRQLSTSTAPWDIVVIGGGATGLGIAVDAATRGYRTLLLEQSDFAKGTSSRSTKLIHGGVRYLAQGQVGLVLEALQERHLLLQNAPHLVKKQAFILPVYTWPEALTYYTGLKLYDLLAGRRSLGSSSWLSKAATQHALPNVNATNLKGGIRYYDCQFDDSRLAINLAQTAVDHGACVLNYLQVSGLLKSETGKITGVTATDLETKTSYQIHAKVVVNATGVFVDNILQLEQPQAKPLVRPSQGVHLVVDASFLPGANALLIPKTPDRRVLFAVPWQGKLLLGTTDTLRSKAALEPKALSTEIDFILETAGAYLANAPTRADVLSVFAGLRPLAAQQGNPKATKDIARNYKIVVSESNLVTVTGGKWTIYRKMAEATINTIAAKQLLPHRACRTAQLPLHGCVHNVSAHPENQLAPYGADAPALVELARAHPTLTSKIHSAYSYTKAEVVWAVRHEQARTVEDVLARRTRLLFLDAKAALESAPAVAALLAQELKQDQDWVESQLVQFSALAKSYFAPPVGAQPYI